MEIVKLTQDKYKRWNDFCLASDDAWFWHRADWIEYILNYNPKLEAKNFSFLVTAGDETKAIVPLVLANCPTDRNIKEFTYGGWQVQYPAFSNQLSSVKKEDVSKLVFNEIDKLAAQNKVARSYFVRTPLAKSFLNNKYVPCNYLMKFGYLDISLNTRIIDLRKSEEELWSGLRRNHKRNIKKGKDFKVIVYTAKNITKDIFNNYKEMHHKASGRKTRPDETFGMMYDWLKKDLSFLIVAEYKGRQIGFEYYTIYKNNVYGFSAANDSEFGSLPVRHRLEWGAILWMKEHGYLFYEIGWQHYGAQLHDFPDKKLVDISHFKKGFGGFTVPLFQAEKYYDKKYFLDTYKERVNKQASQLEKSN